MPAGAFRLIKRSPLIPATELSYGATRPESTNSRCWWLTVMFTLTLTTVPCTVGGQPTEKKCGSRVSANVRSMKVFPRCWLTETFISHQRTVRRLSLNRIQAVSNWFQEIGLAILRSQRPPFVTIEFMPGLEIQRPAKDINGCIVWVRSDSIGVDRNHSRAPHVLFNEAEIVSRSLLPEGIHRMSRSASGTYLA